MSETPSPLELAWREYLDRTPGSRNLDNRPVAVFTDTLTSFTAGFAAGSSSQNDRLAEALEGLAKAQVLASELRHKQLDQFAQVLVQLLMPMMGGPRHDG